MSRTLVSFKDVQLAYLMNGISAVQELVDSNKASKSTVRRALKKMQETGRDVSSLERWVAEHVGPIGRGRTAPSAGEMRSYKAQQIKNSGPFLRLPLDALGADKGSSVHVRFENDRIVVSMNASKT